MAWQTDRILLYDRTLGFVGEIAPDDVLQRKRVEEINGTHELTLETCHVLHGGTRVLTVDGTGRWREYVVYKPDEDHEKGEHATGTYVCMWSLQYDLMGTVEGNVVQPGMGGTCSSTLAVQAALGGQSTWSVGACDVPAVAAGKGCVMAYNSAWERLKQVAKAWGGEVDAIITVDSNGVVSRRVVLRTHLGSTKVTRRFDWGEDLTSIKRTPDPEPYYCRVVPIGRGQREYAEDDETEFDWPLDISEETPDGRVYIQDDEAAAVFRVADGHGGWRYPTKVVKYDEDDPELLLNAATADLHNHTRPGVSYEADVLQFAEAGMDMQGVALGDDIQCVDYGFNPDSALRVQGRIMRMEVNELAPKTDTKLTLGNLGTSFATTLKDLIGTSTQNLTNRVNHIEGGGTIAYVESLLESINAEINAGGGYAYIVEDEGIITYDIAVDDPLIGYNSQTHTWASQVVQMKGGTIRFANTKKPSFAGINDWNWTNVITADGYLGLAATIAKITAGSIGNSSGGNYWDLDNNFVRLAPTTLLDDRDIESVFNDITNAGKANALVRAYSGGVLICRQGNTVGALVNADGSFDIVSVSWSSSGVPTPGVTYATYGDVCKIGQISKTSCQQRIQSDGFYLSAIDPASTNVLDFFKVGYGDTNNVGMIMKGAYFNFGYRRSGTEIGYNSIVGGSRCAATKRDSVAMGYECTVNHMTAFAFGDHLVSTRSDQLVCGHYNLENVESLFTVGRAAYAGSTTRADAFRVYETGSAWLEGTLTQSSDRRLKEHHAYLGEDACEFIRALKPALYTKDGARHVGFYAQDVQAAEPEGWDTETVTEQHTDESLDFDPLTLDYNALIAPLVAYAQQLERRIDQQQKQIDALIERLNALEGGV